MLDTYTSCCIIVENIQKEVYILPRQYLLEGKIVTCTNDSGSISFTPKYKYETKQVVTFNHVKEELEYMLKTVGINDYKMEVCCRKYVTSNPTIPRETEYIKLSYTDNGNIS